MIHPLAPSSRQLLNRILDQPDLARTVRSLEPKVLNQLIRRCGLEDTGEVIALASSEQLMHIFDDDLWQCGRAGEEEQFDAERFGLWLEVLAGMGPPVAAEKIAGMDLDFVTGAFSRHILVLDDAWMALRMMAYSEGGDVDPSEWERASWAEKALEGSLSHEFSGCTVVSKRDAFWDAVLLVLLELEDGFPEFFGELMERCARIDAAQLESDGGLYEVLTEGERVMSDVAADREARRALEGYVDPVGAAAFLAAARQWKPGGPGSTRDTFADTVRENHLRSLKDRAGQGAGTGEGARVVGEERESGLAALLRECDLFPGGRALLPAGGPAPGVDRLARIREELQYVRRADPAVFSERMDELAFLANVLVAGCSFQSRRFRPVEAADAALAACSLGLEVWPHRGGERDAGSEGAFRDRGDARPPLGFLLGQDLVPVFKAGWNVIYERVSLYVAKSLAGILDRLRCEEPRLRRDLAELGRRLKRRVREGTPWKERDNLDIIALLDQPAWAVLAGLLDECPVVPRFDATETGAPESRRIAATREFISGIAQVQAVERFVESLPDLLP
ncbi:MAG: hypothetical protein JXP48_00410 [Acidobacteria bacterium]|nr:hypothetical protein [Acidobacteriota bacterium]